MLPLAWIGQDLGSNSMWLANWEEDRLGKGALETSLKVQGSNNCFGYQLQNQGI
jgi:hypothetical protein